MCKAQASVESDCHSIKLIVLGIHTSYFKIFILIAEVQKQRFYLMVYFTRLYGKKTF